MSDVRGPMSEVRGREIWTTEEVVAIGMNDVTQTELG